MFPQRFQLFADFKFDVFHIKIFQIFKTQTKFLQEFNPTYFSGYRTHQQT
jgi:hypothetical protein